MVFSGNHERSASVVDGTETAVAACAACTAVSGGMDAPSASSQNVGTSAGHNNSNGRS